MSQSAPNGLGLLRGMGNRGFLVPSALSPPTAKDFAAVEKEVVCKLPPPALCRASSGHNSVTRAVLT